MKESKITKREYILTQKEIKEKLWLQGNIESMSFNKPVGEKNPDKIEVKIETVETEQGK
jgi:hypothetical protein